MYIVERAVEIIQTRGKHNNTPVTFVETNSLLWKGSESFIYLADSGPASGRQWITGLECRWANGCIWIYEASLRCLRTGPWDKWLEIIVIYMHCIEDFLKISRVSLANIEVWRTWSAMCMSLCRRGTQDAIVWTRIDQTLHLSLRLSLSINKWRIVSQMVCCWSSLEFHRSRFTALEYRISEMLSPITMKFKLSTAP